MVFVTVPRVVHEVEGPGVAAAAPELNLPWQIRAATGADHGPLPSGPPNLGGVGSTIVDGWRTGQGYREATTYSLLPTGYQGVPRSLSAAFRRRVTAPLS